MLGQLKGQSCCKDTQGGEALPASLLRIRTSVSISPQTEKVKARVGLSSKGPSAGLGNPLFEMATRLCVGGMAGAISLQLWVPDTAFHVLPASGTSGTHLVLSGRLALLQPDPKSPWGSLLVLLDNVDTPGGSGSCSTVFWDEQ